MLDESGIAVVSRLELIRWAARPSVHPNSRRGTRRQKVPAQAELERGTPGSRDEVWDGPPSASLVDVGADVPGVISYAAAAGTSSGDCFAGASTIRARPMATSTATAVSRPVRSLAIWTPTLPITPPRPKPHHPPK